MEKESPIPPYGSLPVQLSSDQFFESLSFSSFGAKRLFREAVEDPVSFNKTPS